MGGRGNGRFNIAADNPHFPSDAPHVAEPVLAMGTRRLSAIEVQDAVISRGREVR